MINKPPPDLFLRFFRWFAHPRLRDHIEGDLVEVYNERVQSVGRHRAGFRFALDVLMLLRPGIIRPAEGHQRLNSYGMFKNYVKVGWRNILNEKGYSAINIGGFAVGIATAMIIGMWIADELTYDKHLEHYERIAAVLQNNTMDGNVDTNSNQSYQLGEELRTNYGSYFEHVVMSYPSRSILTLDDKKFAIIGSFMESGAPELFPLEMLEGTRAGIQDPSSILLSKFAADKFFAGQSAVGKILKIDNDTDLKIAGVYKDFPVNSSFYGELDFIAPLDVIISRGERNIGRRNLGWVNNWIQVYVLLEKGVSLEQASIAIRDAKRKYYKQNDPVLFLYGMPRWHTYSNFTNGVNAGGRIEMLWLFGAIGVFIVLLACVNFMNLSTARARKRAKEITVRKVVGSARADLVRQFFTESLLTVTLAFLIAMILVQGALPWFNIAAQKSVTMPWTEPVFWLVFIGFIVTAAIVAGSYPALYLSSFKPVSVLRGSIRYSGSSARKSMVVFQFAVSITLIIITAVVYKQLMFVKDKPRGYDLDGLITIPIRTEEVKKNYIPFRNDLLTNGLAAEVCRSETPVTNMPWGDFNFQWRGKDPLMQDAIHRGAVDFEFGKTVSWQIKEGRDFSRDFESDSSAMILNEAAVRYMGLENPVGETIRQYGRDFTVIGVVHDMVTLSIYEPAKQTIFIIDPFNSASYITVKLIPGQTDTETLARISRIFSKYNVSTPFEYRFAEEDFGYKVKDEEQMGSLVAVFAILAICISCLGLFGLSSFVAEQRSKEIGVRKVLGASVVGLWKMLSQDFVMLVCVSIVFATPVAYLLAYSWLQNYTYRTEVTWWLFAASGLGGLLVTLLTVSYQSLRASMSNPVRNLRSE
jgi:putative ABC transport system permease protein